MLRYLIYPLFGLCVIATYAFFTATGRDVASASVERRSLPPGARQPSGGFHVAPVFWYGGYAGGK